MHAVFMRGEIFFYLFKFFCDNFLKSEMLKYFFKHIIRRLRLENKVKKENGKKSTP